MAVDLTCVVAVLAAAALTGTPIANAGPEYGNRSAADTVRELESQGYNVGINWIGGNTTAPLSDCRVSDVHNPDSSPPPPATFTTVYVDVVCPNGDDPGFGVSAGLG